MKSFRPVDVTPRTARYTTPAYRILELHIIKHETEPHKPAGVVRGGDVRGHHLAVVVDATGN